MTALAWEGCLNVRDLGGLPTEDGRRTRLGAVVRSDNVRKLTDEGWRALAEHGVERIVDLRWPEELTQDPPRDDVSDHYVFAYGDWLERYRDRFGTVFAAIAEAEGPVVVHCMGGKDRTGVVSAVLLRLAGVGYVEIGEDYAVTSVNLEPSTSNWIPAIADERERARWEKLRNTPADAIVRVVRDLEARYGDVASYLRAAGLSPEQVERLRNRLVAP